MQLAGVERTFEALEDLLVREQAISGCTRELRLFIQERHPKNMAELTKLAESYLEVHDDPYAYWNKKNIVNKASLKQRQSQKDTASTQGHGGSDSQQSINKMTTSKRKPKQCWLCKEYGHVAFQCNAKFLPRNKTGPRDAEKKNDSTAFVAVEKNYFTLENGIKIPIKKDGNVSYCVGIDGRRLEVSAFGGARPGGMPVVPGQVDAVSHLVEVLRDTGCSGAVIKDDLCQESDFTGGTKSCLMINGAVVNVPVAKINVHTPYYSGEVEALAMKNPPYDLIIGNLPGARDANCPDPEWQPSSKEVPACAAVTRSKSEESRKPL